MKKFIIPILGITSVSLIVAFWFYEKRVEPVTNEVSAERQAACEEFLSLALFVDDESAATFMEDCLSGKPVLPGESENTSNPDGESPVEVAPVANNSCMVGGCSSQLCGEASDMEGMVTTCEFREEYACYAKTSRCERQASGKCGWTETAELQKCLQEAGEMGSPF